MRDGTSSSRQDVIRVDVSTKTIEHNEHTHVEHHEQDNNEALRKSKR